jgi:hypothetical protein
MIELIVENIIMVLKARKIELICIMLYRVIHFQLIIIKVELDCE